ncbi:glycerol acyltransferase [Massilia dura]|uniref:Glycerol acyltransferase n=2 Tax=Pseudoduganella dura TaxID=321982 RepID=A0A6I3XCA9_9BURK|nr:glycerol acyltransferase [Pseudoduganella dura]
MNDHRRDHTAHGEHQLTPARLPTVRQRLALRVLHLFGWRMLYRPLPGPRGIAVVYPHTSNWDFAIGLVSKWAMDLPFRWLAKDSMFRMPVLGSWFRWLGGQPVDRSAPQGMIRAQAERMNGEDWYWLVITPEGTRDYRPNWKSGFYHLALEAKVPLVLVSLDYANKVLDFTQHLWLTGDQEQDLAAIRTAYAGRAGKYPQNAAPIELGERRRESRD